MRVAVFKGELWCIIDSSFSRSPENIKQKKILSWIFVVHNFKCVIYLDKNLMAVVYSCWWDESEKCQIFIWTGWHSAEQRQIDFEIFWRLKTDCCLWKQGTNFPLSQKTTVLSCNKEDAFPHNTHLRSINQFMKLTNNL